MKDFNKMTLSFTGTRQGMTRKQMDKVKKLLDELQPFLVVYGDCIRADAEFNQIVIDYRGGILSSKTPRIKLWPSTAKTRAYCEGYDIIMPAKEPLDRNKDIASDGDRLIGCPKEMTEVLRSGTWSTIRYAKKLGKIVYVILPNGDIK